MKEEENEKEKENENEICCGVVFLQDGRMDDGVIYYWLPGKMRGQTCKNGIIIITPCDPYDPE